MAGGTAKLIELAPAEAVRVLVRTADQAWLSEVAGSLDRYRAHDDLDRVPFEDMIAMERGEGPQVLALLDYPSYFDLLKQELPSDREGILARLADDRMIVPNQAGGWDITNLGAILFAKDLDSFRGLGPKSMRVIVYEGKGRLKTIREQTGRKGYASGFEGLIDFVNALLPRNEVIGKTARRLADVSRASHPRAGRQCADSPGFRANRQRTNERDILGSNGNHHAPSI